MRIATFVLGREGFLRFAEFTVYTRTKNAEQWLVTLVFMDLEPIQLIQNILHGLSTLKYHNSLGIKYLGSGRILKILGSLHTSGSRASYTEVMQDFIAST